MRRVAPQRRDRNVTTDNYDVTSRYILVCGRASSRLATGARQLPPLRATSSQSAEDLSEGNS